MQTLIFPAAHSGGAPPSSPSTPSIRKSSMCNTLRPLLHFNNPPTPHSSLASFSLSSVNSLTSLSSPSVTLINHSRKAPAFNSISSGYSAPNDEPDKAKFAQVSKRLESTSRKFKSFGSFGFWGQLICTVVAGTILSFSIIITGKITSPVTFYTTAGGIAAAFISVFWSFGYIRLADRLRKTVNDPAKAPPRADVVRSLKNGIVLNLLGMGSAILGMQATVGLLVAKALTTSVNPYQVSSAGNNPVLALDVFLVQASANTILSHFLGLLCSLELLRCVTVSEGVPVPKVA